jgi:CRISPR/Cas system-associated endonuclease Cas3-HD
MAPNFSTARWRKSSRSAQDVNSDCVELAAMHHHVAIRDSKNPNGPKISLTATQFTTLTNWIKQQQEER